MRKQVGRVVTAVAVVGAVISGCGGPIQAGTAVFVGDHAVPIERVQTELDTVLAKKDLVAQFEAQGGSTADIARSIVTRAVKHDLLTRAAAERGIVVTDEQVDAFIAENGGADALLDGSMYDLPRLRERVRDDLIAAQLAQQEVAGLVVTADLVAATSRADADAAAAALQTGGPEADALFADPNTSRRGETFVAANVPENAATVLFGLPAGAVVSFQPNPQQSTWIVAKVVDRRTDAPSDPAAVGNISQSQLIAIGERLLQPTADQVGIRVNPRYGVWDPIQMQIVGEDQQVGTVLPPLAS
ncbi:MAG TPA: SurA N-terminal domain-containing protein [Pseudonocardia sp.]|uniref:SurA N-terminal domain-containing protein n=1 Tax=Pseudonocardia sp. TaxID=60912 RepID=UPI002B4B59D3|nr:SurA N-terminal domain-containing protein [Pseudonocardia sp.]HLU58339.1 SurA N-terminal domain-containing protein [Pseudonocardia sp.]